MAQRQPLYGVQLVALAPVAVMLLGSGALPGIVAGSELKEVLIAALQASGLPSYLLAPSSGALMSMATASTTAGAAMLHAGATVLDHMPHGSFFHAAVDYVNIQIRERLKLIPCETAVDLMIAFVSTLMFGVFALAG